MQPNRITGKSSKWTNEQQNNNNLNAIGLFYLEYPIKRKCEDRTNATTTTTKMYINRQINGYFPMYAFDNWAMQQNCSSHRNGICKIQSELNRIEHRKE